MSLSVQLYTMLAMAGMGCYFGAALDTYQRFLKRGRRQKWVVFCNDILFWICQGLLIFYVLFLVNYGELRLYIILALVCGYAAYQALFKSAYLTLLTAMISLLITAMRLIRKILHLLIFKPVKGLIFLLLSVIMVLFKGLRLLVKTVISVIIWVLKVVFKPFVLLGGFIWNMLPNFATKPVGRFIQYIAGYIKRNKNMFISLKNRVRTFIQKKK